MRQAHTGSDRPGAKGTGIEPTNDTKVQLRRAMAQDSELLWTWANDLMVRAMSFNEAQIPWAEHQEWLGRKLADPTCMIWIGLDSKGKAFGQIRFDGIDTESVEVDVSLANEFRGKGFGAQLIRAGVRQLELERGLQRVHARVKEHNMASQRAFELAGFMRTETEQTRGQVVEYYTRSTTRETDGRGKTNG